MKPTIQSILQAFFRQFRANNHCSLEMTRAAYSMMNCRTACMGGHINSCPNGHYDQIAYNSCRHRSCPQCSWLAREQWLRKWKERLLPIPHHHCIFTLPHELNGLWFYNKAEYANVLFAAASQTLQELLLDPKYCGGRVGLLCALHTWNQSLLPHIHLHVLVTGGGLDEEEGSWRPLVKSCMLPRKVLMIKFRGKFKALLLKAVKVGKLQLPTGVTEQSLKSLLRRLTSVNWNVKILEQYATGMGVVKYLAKYLRGGPIGNSRLIDCQDGEVRFRYRLGTQAGGDGKKQGVCRIPAVQFIQRLLEHVLPSGFQAIRGYGLYCGNQHSRIGAARQALGVVVEVRSKEEQKQSWQDLCEASGYGEACRCPTCGARLVAHSEFKRGRAPPFQFLGKSGKQGAALGMKHCSQIGETAKDLEPICTEGPRRPGGLLDGKCCRAVQNGLKNV